MKNSRFTIEFPCDGAVLNKHHGDETAKRLKITVKGKAAPDTELDINGIKTFCADGSFDANVELKERFNTIKVSAGAAQQTISVIWDRKSFKRYNFFIDDNIFFLTEIHKKCYKSIFESFYLAKLKEFNARFGTKFVLNAFYRNDHDPFELNQFSDKYKPEWEASSDWLKLTFHAFSEFPSRPYSEHFPEKLPEHYALIKDQIIRIAGEKTFCPPTIIHYFEVSSAASLKYLKDNGATVLSVRNFPESAEKALTNIIYEQESGLFTMPVDFFCNLCTVEQIKTILGELMSKSWKDTINIGTHEQYCYPFYAKYIPNHFERMETAIRLVTEKGYKPVFFHEGLLGNNQ
ncbi:MAG: hypothetical protein WCV67_14750 [Victivallaceae bacterium]|jgi:hypothetical protein